MDKSLGINDSQIPLFHVDDKAADHYADKEAGSSPDAFNRIKTIDSAKVSPFQFDNDNSAPRRKTDKHVSKSDVRNDMFTIGEADTQRQEAGETDRVSLINGGGSTRRYNQLIPIM